MDELFLALNEASVRYLLIGGQAMRLMGMPRFSMDWDIFIPPGDEANFELLNQVLDAELDLPLIPLGPQGENFVQTYQTSWGVVQFHLALPGVRSFEQAEAVAVRRTTEHGTPVKCMAGSDLLIAKMAANRPQDQVDIQFLQELRRVGKL